MFSDSRAPIGEWAKHLPGVKPASPTIALGGPPVAQDADARIDPLACQLN